MNREVLGKDAWLVGVIRSAQAGAPGGSYLVNPNNPLETHVLGSKIFDSSAAATFHVEDVAADDSDLQGWYVTATATYDLQDDNELRIESVTSTLAVYAIT